MEGVKILFPSTAFSIYCSHILLIYCSSFTVAICINMGITFTQQEPPWRLNYWQWHLIYWKGRRQRVYFRSNRLYEESPQTLQMLSIQIKGRYMSPLFLGESSTSLHDSKQSSPTTDAISAGWINAMHASTSEVTPYLLPPAPYRNTNQTTYPWRHWRFVLCALPSLKGMASYSSSLAPGRSFGLYTNIFCI